MRCASDSDVVRMRAVSGVRSTSIQRRILIANAVVVGLALLLLIVTPVTVSANIRSVELAILLAGGVAMLIVGGLLTRRALRPLRTLAAEIDRIDPHEGAVGIAAPGTQVREVESVTRALSAMVDRLAEERRQTAQAVLAGQEGERSRVARELHDEVGQGLIAIKLMAERAAAGAEPIVAAQFLDVADRIEFYLDELRRIAHELRPELLEDLGLGNALLALASAAEADYGLTVQRVFSEPAQRDIDVERELVVYRVAQEALTNAGRHSGASIVRLDLSTDERGTILEVSDDGSGIGEAADGVGIKGMRERARLIGGSLQIDAGPHGGTRVRLMLPAKEG